MSFLVFLLCLQVVATGAVMVVLFFVMKKMLLDLAFQHLAMWRLGEEYREDRSGVTVVVTSADPVPQGIARRLIEVVRQNIQFPVEVRWRVDRAIIGGAVLLLDGVEVDFSLRDRLRSIVRRSG